MDDVIPTTPGIMAIAMTLGTVADWMVAIVAGALGGEANGEGRLLGGAAVLILADH